MAIGAKDRADRRIVLTYKNTVTTDLKQVNRVDPNEMLYKMALMSINNQMYLTIKQNLGNAKNLREKKVA